MVWVCEFFFLCIEFFLFYHRLFNQKRKYWVMVVVMPKKTSNVYYVCMQLKWWPAAIESTFLLRSDFKRIILGMVVEDCNKKLADNLLITFVLNFKMAVNSVYISNCGWCEIVLAHSHWSSETKCRQKIVVVKPYVILDLYKKNMSTWYQVLSLAYEMWRTWRQKNRF